MFKSRVCRCSDDDQLSSVIFAKLICLLPREFRALKEEAGTANQFEAISATVGGGQRDEEGEDEEDFDAHHDERKEVLVVVSQTMILRELFV